MVKECPCVSMSNVLRRKALHPAPSCATHLQAATHSGSASRHSALDRTHAPWPLHSPLIPPLPVDRPGHDRCRGAELTDGEGEGDGDGDRMETAGPALGTTVWEGVGAGEDAGTWSQYSPVSAVPLQSHTAPSPVTMHLP